MFCSKNGEKKVYIIITEKTQPMSIIISLQDFVIRKKIEPYISKQLVCVCVCVCVFVCVCVCVGFLLLGAENILKNTLINCQVFCMLLDPFSI